MKWYIIKIIDADGEAKYVAKENGELNPTTDDPNFIEFFETESQAQAHIDGYNLTFNRRIAVCIVSVEFQ